VRIDRVSNNDAADELYVMRRCMDGRTMAKTKLSAVTGRVHVQVVSALSAAIADDPTSLQDPGNLADV
jgi:hypothetical protein